MSGGPEGSGGIPGGADANGSQGSDTGVDTGSGFDDVDSLLQRGREARARRRGEPVPERKPAAEATEPEADDDNDNTPLPGESTEDPWPDERMEELGLLTQGEIAALNPDSLEVYGALVDLAPSAAPTFTQLAREWGRDFAGNMQFAASILPHLNEAEIAALAALPDEHPATVWRLGARLGRRLSGGDLTLLRQAGFDALMFSGDGRNPAMSDVYDPSNDTVKRINPSEAQRIEKKIDRLMDMKYSSNTREREQYHSKETQERLQRLFAKRYPGQIMPAGVDYDR